jgi:probable F420-dependent oxidoreductase
MTEWRQRLGRFGVWRSGSQVTPELAAELESLSFGAVWLGGSPTADLLHAERLLDATNTLIVATGIVNVWQADAHRIAESFHRISSRYHTRFLLGVGVGHPEAAQQYADPYDTLVKYLDVLIADGVPPTSMVLAALGPKVLRLAAERTAGAHPYLVTTEHTRRARAVLGANPLLAPEHKVVLEIDPERARAIGRSKVKDPYLRLVNYTNNLRRLGWSERDLSGGGSDTLIDALVAHGSPDDVAAQLTQHLDAGADQVAIQLLSRPDVEPLEGYRQLARALTLDRLNGTG